VILFKFPKKKIVLDCFTTEEYILETAPIVPAIKLIPEWWRELPNAYYAEGSYSPTSTMKHCVGMVDYYKKSIVIPLWSDLIVDIKTASEYQWRFSDRLSRATDHNMEQQATGFLSGYAHLKLHSPWLFKTKEDISWVWSHPVYNYEHSNDVVSLPAVINFLAQPNTNINLLFNASTPKSILIPQGQPLAHLTPMSDRKVDIRRHLITQAEYTRLDRKNTNIVFLYKYAKILNRTKQFKDCPFHNHTKGN